VAGGARRKLTDLFLMGELAAVVYIGGIAAVAAVSDVKYVLFPELAALAFDMFTRPRGTWAGAPLMVITTPVLAAVVGILIERHIPYGMESVLLSVAASVVLIKVLRSPVAPAISAGLLPLSLGEGSWWYPLSILFGTTLLAVLSVGYRTLIAQTNRQTPSANTDAMDDLLEQPPDQYAWLPFFLLFLLGELLLAKISGLRLILFPPLVVIGFEMFSHAGVCPWADRPLVLPVICAATATVGVWAVLHLGSGPLAAMFILIISIALVRAFKVHVPPALAVGLLPLIIHHPDYWFPYGVLLGTLFLSIAFLVFRSMVMLPSRQRGYR